MMRHTVVSGIMETGSHTGRILNEISPTRHEYNPTVSYICYFTPSILLYVLSETMLNED